MVKDMTTHLRLNSIDTIRQLNVVARKYYHNENGEFNHESYIRECFECLLSFFSTELYVWEGTKRENAYLFAALTYKREDSPKIELVKLTDGPGYYFADEVEQDLAKSFSRVIDELYQAIDSEESMSVTKALLKDKKEGKDLFLYTGEPYEGPIYPTNSDVDARIAFLPLDSLNFDPNDDVEHFCKLNEEWIREFRASLDEKAEMKLTESDRQIGVLLWHYKRLEKEYSDYRRSKTGKSGREFLVHFIRPSFIDFGHNILLSLGTNRRLTVDQLSMIYLLVYRIISQTVIEKTKEAERFKRRTSFSLTTHALKTELQISIKPKVNNVKKEIEKLSLPANPILSKVVAELEAQYADLFCMTAFASLIDKIESQKHFEESGRMEGLLVEHPETINILKYCAEYNKTNAHLDDIKVLGGTPRPLSIKVYDSYFSASALRLFMDTIFENVNKFGRRTGKKIELRVSSLASEWTFENDTNDERVDVDLTKIRGNLFLFNLLIEKTDSGKLTISPPGDYKFKVTYQAY
jgi:hypothetical protein